MSFDWFNQVYYDIMKQYPLILRFALIKKSVFINDNFFGLLFCWSTFQNLFLKLNIKNKNFVLDIDNIEKNTERTIKKK